MDERGEPMVNCTREITAEQYAEIMAASNGRGFVPSNLETKYFDESILWGYGLYGTSVKTENGKYYLTYSRGESCD